MKISKHRNGPCPFSFTMATLLVITFAGIAGAQERTGKVQQGLVGGTVISAERQEEYGLVTLSTGCSGSLLRNNWVITAAHCVDNPDPNNAGQFIMVPENSVTVSASWTTIQSMQSMRIITFRPMDVAIIRVPTPFSVRGSTTNYNRDIFRDGQFPYFGTPVGVPITVFGRGINQFAQGSAIPSQQDGQYRVGFFKTTRQDNDSGNRYWYPSTAGQSIAGGDSGGPSYAEVLNRGNVLVGVHSLCKITCAAGQTCGTWPGPGPAPATYSNWQWVTSTPECADAPIGPVWDEINRYLGAFVSSPEPSTDSPPPGFIGTFSKTPANYQPIWVYAIKNDGTMIWYRKDTGESPWQGPNSVGSGWNFKDVIPAGGNSFYALTADGKLIWYQHNGFNNGARDWKAAVEVGHGWTFAKIFSGGEGIVYAIQADGTLLWYRHGGWANGGGPETWVGPKSVGAQPPSAAAAPSICDAARSARARNSPAAPGLEAQCRAVGETPSAPPVEVIQWNQFKDVFSAGEGKVYAVKPDGTLLFYQHLGWQTGERSWSSPRQVGTGWANFRQIIPAGGGVILAITLDGRMLWYKHLGLTRAVSFARLKETWEGPVEVGSGWQGFQKVIALLPVASAPVVR